MLHKFTMCVEATGTDPGFERQIEFDSLFIPHVIFIGTKTYYRSGRYLSPGERYRYIPATVMNLED